MKNKSLGLYMARAQKAKHRMIELELIHGQAAAEDMPEYQKLEKKLAEAMSQLRSA